MLSPCCVWSRFIGQGVWRMVFVQSKMLRNLIPVATRVKHTACGHGLIYTKAGGYNAEISDPVVPDKEAKRKPIEQVLGNVKEKVESIKTVEEPGRGAFGVPEEHQQERTARIFKPAREATQQGWNNTKGWRIELDNRGRWDNQLIGWASSGDPLSNVSMHMKFPTKEDAIAFCQKNNWMYEVEEPSERQINPKNYGSIYSWNKRFRVSTK